MTATRNLLSLAIGLALASPSVFAYDCPADQITTIPQLRAEFKNGAIPKAPTATPAGSGFTSTTTKVVKGQVTAIVHIPVENEHLFRFKMNADSGLRVHRFRTPQSTYSDVR
ncbi:hypothetical protein [Aeromonas allosaccharophila]|uniref:hypothetical protein n=1 Tax=Aeromonas allosaccharophila TaxID=656 RepID=UPI003D1AF349